MSKFANIGIPTNRFETMMRMIPRAPESISTERLLEKLHIAGFVVDLRTVQRNLKELADCEELGLTSEKVGREAARWQYRSDVPVTVFPSLDDHTALAFQLADRLLTTLLPSETVKALRPFMEEADNHLGKRRKSAASKWKYKIHVYPKGVRRKAPTIRPEVQAAVYQAILEEKPLRLMHLSRGKPDAKEFLVSPLGLVSRDYLIYLYGLTKEKKQVLAFALNRTQSAEILEGAVFEKPPKDFSLAEHEHLVSVPIKGSPIINLKLRLEENAAYSLRECPLASRQSINSDPEHPGREILIAEVANTVELRQWILSLGPSAEVLAPIFLRREIANQIAAMAHQYSIPSMSAD